MAHSFVVECFFLNSLGKPMAWRTQEYYPHFLILLVLDFMEELAQNQESLDRVPENLMARGRLVPSMTTEVSENGKSLICWKEGERERNIWKVGVAGVVFFPRKLSNSKKLQGS